MSKTQFSVEEIRIPVEQMQNEFDRILLKYGFANDRAETCAKIFVENSLDGIYTHGVNRFPRFIKYVNEKVIDPNSVPEKKFSAGTIEQWDGLMGPGPLNALACTDRAMELAKQFGIGCVAMANTNHWMRGGTYGWRSAKAGFVFIGWTNTIGIMPAWGATDSRLGNNPLVFALPFNNEAIVLDMAMSQFSYGKMETAKRRGEQLPFSGGYDKEGKLTKDPVAILDTWRALPIGYWKGAGFALLLDLLATILSGGLSTHEISKSKYEQGVSQVFIAIDISKLGNYSVISKTVNEIIDDYHRSIPESDSVKILYPGERVLQTRMENMVKGIPVDTKLWEKIKTL